jgi:hypothetical protein
MTRPGLADVELAAEAMRTYGDNIPTPITSIRYVSMKQPVGKVIITPAKYPVVISTVNRRMVSYFSLSELLPLI